MPILEKTPEPPPQIHAIAHVRVQARPGLEHKLRWFYAELLGLDAVDGEEGTLCFQTKTLQLRVMIAEGAQPSPMRRRLVLVIPSLEEMRVKFEDIDLEYEWYEGMAFTDRRLFVLDPAENRVELKQVWVL
jgi:catechol 2,3-dioxygenase-like lactoylglutathione lyase family enzyme